MTSNGYQESMVLPKVDKLIPVILLMMFILAVLLLGFAILGVYQSFFNVPEKNRQITELTSHTRVLQARVKDLDGYIQLRNEYIQNREDKFKVATKFSNLFMCIADPKQVMAFEGLEEYIANKKEFFELRR